MSQQLRQLVSPILKAAHVGPLREIQKLPGGRNNRVYRVDAGNDQFLLKHYYSSEDSRDRLASEWSFAKFCWSHGIETVPRPVFSQPSAGLAMFEWIPGVTPAANQIDNEMVDRAITFVKDINRHRDATDAQTLPDAAEACYCIADHLRCVDRRIGRMASIHAMPEVAEIIEQTAQFVRCELEPKWRSVEATVRASEGLGQRLGGHDRVLSPSDFGFHNTLLMEGGGLRFVDFEYAGWDDPAKLVCDFFCQVDVPAPQGNWDRFVQSLMPLIEHPDALPLRCGLLRPIYQIKWCCIVLNEFLPEHETRRTFSGGMTPGATQLGTQLQKSRDMLKCI